MFEIVKELDLLEQFTRQIAKINANNFSISDIVTFNNITNEEEPRNILKERYFLKKLFIRNLWTFYQCSSTKMGSYFEARVFGKNR